MCFYHFHFFFWWSIKFPQQHINQSETWIGGVQMSVELYATIWMWPAIDRKYKTNNFSKIRQELPDLFFFHVRLWNYSFQLLTTLKIALATYTLWQNKCKTVLPKKNICDGVQSYSNWNFKIYRWKLEIKTV